MDDEHCVKTEDPRHETDHLISTNTTSCPLVDFDVYIRCVSLLLGNRSKNTSDFLAC